MFYLTRRLFVLLIVLAYSSTVYSQAENINENDAKSTNDSAMTVNRMIELITNIAGEYQGSGSNIQFVFQDVPMALLSDVKNNRMRIIAPITEVTNLTDAHIKAAMVSNFHLALDGRYAIGNGVMYATYIHPLAELTDEQLEKAIYQVSTLRLTFGTTYTSGGLTYGGRNLEEQDI